MTRMERLKNLLGRLLRRRPKPPPEPAERLVALRRGPKPRSGAAVAELDEEPRALKGQSARLKAMLRQPSPAPCL